MSEVWCLLQLHLVLQWGLLGLQGHHPKSSPSGSRHWKSTGMDRSWDMSYVTVSMDMGRVPGQAEILQMRCSAFLNSSGIKVLCLLN
jgi:hypothetical protein